MADKQRVSQPSKFDYDYLNDTFYAYHKEREYISSLVLDGIIIDLNEDKEFIGIEVLNASKTFGISKHELLSPIELAYNVKISDDELIVSLKLTFIKRNHPVVKTFSAIGINDMNLSPASNTLALA